MKKLAAVFVFAVLACCDGNGPKLEHRYLDGYECVRTYGGLCVCKFCPRDSCVYTEMTCRSAELMEFKIVNLHH